MIARIHSLIDKGRLYEVSQPEIEWTCCPGVICGHASRRGVDTKTGCAVYRLSGRRHPAMTGKEVIVQEDGTLLRLWDRSVVETV